MINLSQPDFASTPAQRLSACWDYRPRSAEVVPLVSIVTPFYNTGPEFDETAAVVFRQSLQNWEWIIVNDCSTDRVALQRLRAVQARDPRIRVTDLPTNHGPSHARNLGINQARAEYIFKLDSDDLIEPTALEKLVWFLEVNPRLSFARGFDVGFGAESYLWTKGFHCGSEFLGENIVQTNSLVRKSVFPVTGGYDESIKHGYEDWDFWLRCAAHGLWGDTLPEYLHWYRRRVNHADKWKDFESTASKDAFRQSMLLRYGGLNTLTFPKIPARQPPPYGTPVFRSTLVNPLAKKGRRLLILLPHLEMGGADKFNLDLIRQLQQRHSWEITVVTTLSAASAWYHLFTALTSDVFVLPNFLQLVDYPAFLSYLITSRSYDAALISNSSYGYNLLPFLRSEFPALPVLDYVHMEEEYWRSGGYARFSANYAPLLDGTVASSSHLREWMISHGHEPGKVSIAYTNIDAQLWSRSTTETEAAIGRWNLNRSACRILFAGRLCDQKQPEVFVQVARLLLDEGLDVQFIVAGDGPSRAKFEPLTALFPPERFRMVGAISPAEIRSLLGGSHILFLPSKMEGIALVMFEAMSMGVVPVGAHVGGQAELVNEDCGILIERSGDEVQKYAAALRQLIADSRRRDRLAQNARERITRHHSLDSMGETLHRLLVEAARRRHLAEPAASPPPDPRLAQLFLLEATEQQRLELLAQSLWLERQQLPLGKRNGQSTELVVFPDLGQGYNEQNSIKRAVEPGKDLDIWIRLPHPISGGRLRIDPISCMGMISLSAIYLRWKQENLAFWQAATPAELAALEFSGTAIVCNDGVNFRILSYGPDPIITLPYVVPEDPSAPVMLQLIFRFEAEIPRDLVKVP